MATIFYFSKLIFPKDTDTDTDLQLFRLSLITVTYTYPTFRPPD